MIRLPIPAPAPQLTVFGPHPLLEVRIESRGGVDDVHLHAGGQGVWVSRMAGTLGAAPILCGFVGGETGTTLRPLLSSLPGSRRLVPTTGASGTYVVDVRGERRMVATRWAQPPTSHELDDLVSTTIGAALFGGSLLVCNPFPGDTLPVSIYGDLVADARANGVPVLVDLSTPRLDSALSGSPDLVKLNDWELAELIRGPVASPHDLRAAAETVLERGAGAVVVTRGGEPALALHGDEALWIVPPRLERGHREGCGDSMFGAMAAVRAAGVSWPELLVVGAAAGAANFLRHGLGTGSAELVADLVPRVRIEPWSDRLTTAA